MSLKKIILFIPYCQNYFSTSTKYLYETKYHIVHKKEILVKQIQYII